MNIPSKQSLHITDYYKAEDTDDEENNNDLLARLYSEIYYPSNNEIELGANILSNAVPLSDCIVNESTHQENVQNKLHDKAISKLEVTKGQEEPVAEVSVQISKNNLVNQATSNTTEGKKKKKSSSKKNKIHKQQKNRKGLQRKNITLVEETDLDTKYNVLQKSMKQKQLMLKQQRETWEDSSDSESILEVPLPPKPKPLLINLQDSDDEDAGSSIDEDDLLEGRLHGKNVSKGDSNSEIVEIRDRSSSPEVEIVEVSYDRQDTVAKSKVIDKSPRTKNILATKNDKSTRVRVFNEDIVLNCTMVQKGARSINEIKQLSKSTEQNRIDTLIEDTIKCSKKRPLQDASRGNDSNDACTLQEPYWISPERGKETREQLKWMWQNVNTDKTNETRNFTHNLTQMQSMEDMVLEVSCGSNNNPVVNLEKRSEGNSGEARNNSPLRKRQCTVQQGDQPNVAPTPCSSGNRVKKSDSFWIDYFFKPLPEKIKKFYNDSRGQENFNMHELQDNMSKDPNMWAILDEDLMPSPAIKRHRYWSKFTKCNNCQRDGHMLRDCPHPLKERCCYMCGEQGHEIWSCPKKQCLNCGTKQTSYIKTCEHCRTLYCTMCHSTGHNKEFCPDLWRRYHHITKSGGGVLWSLRHTMKPASQLYCCNCSKRGHESSTCKEYRWSLHFPTPAVVTNYTDGPMYELEVSSEEILTNTKTANASLLRTRDNRMLNQQMQNNIPVMRTQAGPSPNVDASSSLANAKTYERVNTQENTEEHVMPISKAPVLQFTNVIYCCGNFRQKNRDAWVLVSNLSQHKALSSCGKLFLQDRFMNGTIIPVFLKKLRKIAEFKLMIGPLVTDPEVIVQLMAPKECVYLLFYLLLYWLNLPLSEKKQGIKVNLPTNTGEMYDFLMNLKLPRPNKDLQNPLEFINAINNYKKKLHNMPKDDNYFRNQMHMQSIQTKLLAYIHTHPKRSEHFRKILSYRNKLKHRDMSKQLSAATYFDILLSYNNMYTPHTPPNLRVTLYNILKHQQKQNLKKKSNLTPEQLPSNADLSVPFMTSSSQMPQEIDTEVNSFATADIQDTSDVSEVKNVGNIYQPGTSDVIENLMRCPQYISSFNSEPISIYNERHLSKKMKKKLKLENEMRFKQVTLYKKARQVADQALAFKSSHMIQAAENLEKNIKNKTLKSKHIKALRKMIDLEKKHQKHIKMYYNHLN